MTGPTPCRATPDGYALDGEHYDDCADTDACPGCFPCVPRTDHGDPLGHCTARGRCSTHVAEGVLTCPKCMARTRDDLATIARRTAELPAEAVERGVDSEAAMLAGPAAHPVDWSRRVSLDAEQGNFHDHDRDEPHPLFELGRWEMALREDYNMPTGARLTVDSAADFLTRVLDRFAQDPEQDFPLFVREVTACRVHLEAVLHDQQGPETSQVPCIKCGTRLARRYGDDAKDDHHHCPSCRRTYTHREFVMAMSNWLASEGAEKLVRVQDARDAIGRPPRTWRKWLRFWHVRSYIDARGQMWVWWPDVREADLSTPRRKRVAA